MSDQGKLSQEEIDALLHQTAPATEENSNSVPDTDERETLLTDEEKDVLGEIGNISFGSASTALSTLLQQRVEITTPEVRLYRAEELQTEFPRPYVMVSVEYTAGLRGTNALAIELQDAKTIADLMLGGDGSNTSGELQELHLSAVSEAMNQMMGGAATSMSTIFSRPINISPPSVTFVDLSSDGELEIGFSGWIACVSFRLKVGSLIDSQLMQLVPVEFAKEVVSLLTDSGVSDSEPASNETAGENSSRTDSAQFATATQQTASSLAAVQAHIKDADSAASTMRAPTSPSSGNGGDGHWGGQDGRTNRRAAQEAYDAHVMQPDFAELEPDNGRREETPRNLGLILDVNLNLTVELGRTKRPIREILELAPGSVLELDKLAGEPVDILVNNRRIAIGEVVVIDENFGVRVTDIVNTTDRVKSFQ